MKEIWNRFILFTKRRKKKFNAEFNQRLIFSYDYDLQTLTIYNCRLEVHKKNNKKNKLWRVSELDNVQQIPNNKKLEVILSRNFFIRRYIENVCSNSWCVHSNCGIDRVKFNNFLQHHFDTYIKYNKNINISTFYDAFKLGCAVSNIENSVVNSANKNDIEFARSSNSYF